MLRLVIGLLFFAIFSVADAQPAPDARFALKDGDRVVFYGDSITAQRLYTRFVEDIVVSRYPQMHVSFFNAGVSGDTVSGGHAGDMATRVKRDVVPWQPTVVTIMLGMNDGRYTAEFDANFKAYADGYHKLIAAIRNAVPGVRLFLVCPSPYDEVGHPSLIPGYNGILLRYGQFVSDLGKQEGIPVIDLNGPMTAAIHAGMKIDPLLAGALLPDRIHPSPSGHWIMASAIAKGWNLDPVISSTTIRAPDGKVEDQYNTSVTEIQINQNKIFWKQEDGAVPLPLELNDPFVQFLFQVSDLAQLDQQLLRVTGLTGAEYVLSIDQQKIGTFSREELAKGINLATLQTPMEQSAKAIDWTADDRGKVGGARFDLLTEKETIPSRVQGLEALDLLDQRMIIQEYDAAKPKAHAFELVVEGKQ